ncbi:hypothetical protein A3765_04325 [Oleiphilus sp. HI0130]|uniref:HDOD domain-containing protein n=2 Tax=Oleiphilus sp. HI0079 TaxID=1822254 RepID=UPI0007C3E1F8|nr:HDOD domain-containing protein [Oleiphilus sp. HI0079]KZZ17435.1 hypothetical protein A3750_09500 [Oleiphilus sp. HI0079]KZZ44907.1 hypothetical protein A3758_02895 [Oleiphilus sp. HI0118]KZZ67796.1 hypothetical protein A3765_04325 [Oleiphilus sp. HI0130]
MITEDQKTELVFELSADLRELGKQVVVRLSKGDIDVPLFPAIATEVMRLANSPESDAAGLADLIQSDPNLAGHVMRVANSALYTPKASMVSLQQAIARLGMNLICEISLGVALNAKLFNAPGYENRLSDISQHGFCSALWSKEIARASQENVESAFLCGLLHGIGRAAFLQMFSDMAVMNGIKLDADKVRELEDVMHPLFGQEINQAWEMPKVVCLTSFYSNNYSACDQYRQQAAVVNAGAKLASASLDGADLEPVLKAEVFQHLNLYQDQLHELTERRDQIVAAVRAHKL